MPIVNCRWCRFRPGRRVPSRRGLEGRWCHRVFRRHPAVRGTILPSLIFLVKVTTIAPLPGFVWPPGFARPRVGACPCPAAQFWASSGFPFFHDLHGRTRVRRSPSSRRCPPTPYLVKAPTTPNLPKGGRVPSLRCPLVGIKVPPRAHFWAGPRKRRHRGRIHCPRKNSSHII